MCAFKGVAPRDHIFQQALHCLNNEAHFLQLLPPRPQPALLKYSGGENSLPFSGWTDFQKIANTSFQKRLRNVKCQSWIGQAFRYAGVEVSRNAQA